MPNHSTRRERVGRKRVNRKVRSKAIVEKAKKVV